MKQQIIDSKANSNSIGEADECLFEYLHAELVNYVLSKSSNTTVSITCIPLPIRFEHTIIILK